jgi:Uma2 family endonuclease
MATAHRKITAREFLEFDLGPEGRFELQDGAIYAMTGGTPAHARVQANLMRYLGNALRGSGCRPYGPDMPLQTMAHTLRYPDLAVYCGNPGLQETPGSKLLPDPRVIIEVLSPGTRALDEGRKLEEYQSLASVVTVALVDPDAEWVKVHQRGPSGEWDDFLSTDTGAIPLPSLGLTIPKDEIFARD